VAAGALLSLPAVIGLVSIFPEGRYLLRAAYEELRILARRRSIEQIVADPSTPRARAEQLALVLDARRFAAESLGLDAGDTYTTFAEVGRDTLLLVLSASERYRLVPYTWRYPIVGIVPYKGFFDPGAARAEARRIMQDGFDVYLRPAGAFSTLGWFSDPLLSTILDRGSVELVATVLHELAHNTLYVRSATPFNESFANFVGYRAAERFFEARGDTGSARAAAADWERELRADQFFERLATRLDSLYASEADSMAIDGRREQIFREAREAAGRPEWDLNNAVVIAARLYRTDLEIFDRWLERSRGDVALAVRNIEERVRGRSDPYDALALP